MLTPKRFAFMFKPLPGKSKTEREQNHTDTQNQIVITTQFRGDRTRAVRLLRRRLESVSSVRFFLSDPRIFPHPPAPCVFSHQGARRDYGLGTVLSFSLMAEATGVERAILLLTRQNINLVRTPKEDVSQRHVIYARGKKTQNDNLCRWCSL